MQLSAAGGRPAILRSSVLMVAAAASPHHPAWACKLTKARLLYIIDVLLQNLPPSLLHGLLQAMAGRHMHDISCSNMNTVFNLIRNLESGDLEHIVLSW